MTKDEIKDRNSKYKAELQCTDLCEHCTYIESGDFICNINDDVTIVGWKPFPCAYPKRRSLKGDRRK